MKPFFKIITTVVFAILIPQTLPAINPLYQLEVANVQISGPRGLHNELEFDIILRHTNFSQSGPFEFSQGQYNFNFNPLIANGGTLSYTKIPGSSDFANPFAEPRDPHIVGNQLILIINQILGAGNGPIISPLGTRVIRMKIATTASEFAPVPLNLQWRDSTYSQPNTQVFGYVGNVSTNITNNGTLVINYPDPPLPVELTAFSSNVNRNNVTLNWTTSNETNNSGFRIERSESGNPDAGWTKVGFVNGNGTTNQSHNYTFKEMVSTGRYNYRLVQIDYNGSFENFNLNNEVIAGVPEKFYLSQNYPNPFNPETTIDYDLLSDGKVSIVLLDISGREISKPVDDFKKAGYYSYKFSAGNLPSGIYFYRLTFENGFDAFTSTKKMILIK